MNEAPSLRGSSLALAAAREVIVDGVVVKSHHAEPGAHRPIPYAEWRALVAQGPAIVMMARDDAVGLLDHAEACERLCRDFAALSPDHPPGGVDRGLWGLAVEKARELTRAAVPA